MIQIRYEKGSFFQASEWRQFEPRFFSPRAIRDIIFRELWWKALDGEETLAHRFRRHNRQGEGIVLEQYLLLTTHCVVCLHSDETHHILQRFQPDCVMFRPFQLLTDEKEYVRRLVEAKMSLGKIQFLNPDLFPEVKQNVRS